MKLKIKHTPQGYSYIDVTLANIQNWGGPGICNGCNKGPFKKMKLIWALHDTYCEDCFNKWLKELKNMSKSDIREDLQLQKYVDKEWYKTHMSFSEKVNYE